MRAIFTAADNLDDDSRCACTAEPSLRVGAAAGGAL
jgi:hypothetical protein